MKTSIIICTRNRLVELLRFIDSLLKQTDLPSELIIVDGGDKKIIKNLDISRKISELNLKMNFKYVHSKPGLTKQRNIGVKVSKGNILYFFDDDIILEPDFIKEMNSTFKKNPEFMGGMGEFTNIKFKNQLKFKQKFKLFVQKIFMLQHEYGDGRFYPSGLPRHSYGINKFMEVEVLAGGLTGYRREVFKKFQFDEKLENYCYLEDVDFSRRVSYNYKLFQNPKARAEHRHTPGGRGSVYQNRKMLMFNHRYIFTKNFHSKGKGSIIAHWWSIFGMFIIAIFNHPSTCFTRIKAYYDGLVEFSKRKQDLLKRQG